MGLSINTTCNATLDDLRIGRSEVHIAGSMTFHTLGLIIAAACALIAILLSFYLIWMHAIHYTKPYEQRHIIRILFMVPVYAAAAFLSFWYYWHAIYFQVISDCYEAFAIASFFALLCHYIAPDLHEQKMYFRSIQPKKWVLPVNWFASCCGGERGPWRTPRSGLTWFNIIWTGIYQYCFIRVTMTVTAVVTQYFNKYCESSNSPVFAHIWILVIEGVAVSIAMYCVIQFYFQLRVDLRPHSPLLKVIAIKLVIFLSFWQSFLISILTSTTFNVVKPTAKVAYPDLKVGIPSLLLCIEMAMFAVLHLFAFPWKPYQHPKNTEYPMSPIKNEIGPKQGGFLGIMALVDAMNPWDLVKGFARGMRWLFVGRKHRENDPSYKMNMNNENDMALEPTISAEGYKRTESLPIAEEFRRSKFGLPKFQTNDNNNKIYDEGAGLIENAQPNPLNPGGYVPARQRYDANGQDISAGGQRYDDPPLDSNPDRLVGHNPTPGTVRKQEHPRLQGQDIGMAMTSPPEPYQSHASEDPEPYQSHVIQQPYAQPQTSADAYREQLRQQRAQAQGRRPSEQEQRENSNQPMAMNEPEPAAGHPAIHNALWGQRPPPPQPQEQHHNPNQF
ncbi:DUF300-domain-containing protein [Mollisia scopiformis]|uniref:DUF300-domain-containing protein n=1 Tax=Mollisia scopiformis TaxID=149040 RepID=A0A194X208_MOLSC|nr:DUF300-domain-containing protein [Mollisia scopiformis]KUJ14231.1 DUF300-domain-containing protein [Mollisia scopiformis]